MMKGRKIINPDGHITYYYYKKKVGRPKKRGRKKTPKQRGRRWQEPWDFKIIRFDFKKQTKYIGVFHNAEEAEYAKSLLIKQNNEVEFPKKYINNGRRDDTVIEANSEYLILKRIRNAETESNITKLRNEYGTFVEHKTTSKDWAIYDKFPCLIEETFWVYGHNPKTDRKTYRWIMDNLVLSPAEEKSNIVLIYLFSNKLIIKYDEDFTFVICKNVSDGIRLYNKIEEETKKVRNVLMTGFTSMKELRGKDTYEMIKRKTGWEHKKITRLSTRA